MQTGKMQERMKRYEGLVGPERTREFALDLWKWAGERQVYWLVDETRLKAFENSLPPGWPDRFTVVATIQLPKAAPRDRRDGPGGGPGGGPPPPARGDGPDDGQPPPPPDGGPGPDDGPPPPRPDDGFGLPDGPPRPMARPGQRPGPGGPGALLTGGKLVLVEWTAK